MISSCLSHSVEDSTVIRFITAFMVHTILSARRFACGLYEAARLGIVPDSLSTCFQAEEV